MSSPLKNVVVYCGSRDGAEPCYLENAEALGKELLKNQIGLVYGAGKHGLMGRVSKTVHDGGGKVTGIISEHLHAGLHDGYGETIIVKTMHDRKKLMFDKVDGFIALPGGFGTMEELLEIITWYQLNLHDKPIGILNINNYYDKFLEWIDHSINQGFIDSRISKSIIRHHDPTKLLHLMLERARQPSLALLHDVV